MTNQLDLVVIFDSPCASIEWNFIAVGSVNRVPFPFVLRYFACLRYDHCYPIYLVRPCSQQTSLLVPVILQLRDLVTRLQTLWCNITEWAQSTCPITRTDKSCSDLLTYSSTIYFRTPKVHCYSQHISVRRWDTNQSLLIDDNYVWSLRSKD